MGIRVHLCGRPAVEGPGGVSEDRELAGRQGRLALAFLALERRHPVATDRLADAVWGEQLPADAGGSLAAVISRLRTVLRRVGRCGPEVITSAAACYHLRLPPGSFVDVEAARTAIDRAEGHRRHGEVASAWSSATVAVSIAQRGVLPGETADWVLQVRRELDRITQRGYGCLSWVWSTRGNGDLAVAMAEQAVALDALHEPSWRSLMRAHAACGSRAAAVRTYRRCREVLAEELGVHPDEATEALHRQLLG